VSQSGSLVITAQAETSQVTRPVRKYSLAWTTDPSLGTVGGNKTDGSGVTSTSDGSNFPGRISGELLRVVFIPADGGVQPSNNYSAKLLDENGVDLLSGVPTTNLSSTTVSDLAPSVPMKDGTTVSTIRRQIDDILELQISAAGNSKQGTVVLYVR
jgi:hypothetical protein